MKFVWTGSYLKVYAFDINLNLFINDEVLKSKHKKYNLIEKLVLIPFFESG